MSRRALEWLLLLGAALVAFVLPARPLHVAASPYTDESVFAKAGRRLAAGQGPALRDGEKLREQRQRR